MVGRREPTSAFRRRIPASSSPSSTRAEPAVDLAADQAAARARALARRGSPPLEWTWASVPPGGEASGSVAAEWGRVGGPWGGGVIRGFGSAGRGPWTGKMGECGDQGYPNPGQTGPARFRF